ncbi:hypothetical protein FI667_g6538, partial [Globisporangium splendens]
MDYKLVWQDCNDNHEATTGGTTQLQRRLVDARENEQEKLSHYIICAVVHEEELQTFRFSDAEDPDNLCEAIEDLCAILKQTRELKAAFKNGEELSEWSALSVIMAQVTMEVDSVEPSSRCQIQGVVWINVYAPIKKPEREHFFRRLNEEFLTHRAAAVLGGDFNFVLDKCRYPIRTSRSDLVRTVVQKAIAHELQSEGPIEWSRLEQRIIKAILRVGRAEKRQVQRYRRKLEDQQHRPANRTRRELIEEQANAAREAAEFKFGKYMQATQGDVREDVMVEVLVREFNNIRRGAPMPRSFGQGIVIPLLKKGDSSNPLDCRPITLLTTTYKLFAKVLATRLQGIILRIIGDTQQGFVRDRLMENAILIIR